MRKLLFTGSSGFLGKNILLSLQKDFKVSTIGLSEEEDYNVNIATTIPQLKEHFDVVLHAAGKAHSIPQTETEKKQFFDINYQRTKNLCKALEDTGLPESFIFISTVAVYGLEFGEDIDEDYPLNGNTLYALSKIKAEQFLTEWSNKNNVRLGVIHPALIAGPNPPRNLGDMIFRE